MTTRTDDDVLDRKGAAALLKVSVRKLTELVDEGVVPSVKLGRHRLFRRSSILDWLAELERKQRADVEERKRELEGLRDRAAGREAAERRSVDAAREVARRLTVVPR